MPYYWGKSWLPMEPLSNKKKGPRCWWTKQDQGNCSQLIRSWGHESFWEFSCPDMVYGISTMYRWYIYKLPGQIFFRVYKNFNTKAAIILLSYALRPANASKSFHDSQRLVFNPIGWLSHKHHESQKKNNLLRPKKRSNSFSNLKTEVVVFVGLRVSFPCLERWC